MRGMMDSACLLAFLTLSITCHSARGSVLNWFWGKSTDDTTVLVADGIPLVSIPYESMTEDEKFLQEAAKFTDIQVSSPLETCQHKVIMRIKTSCSDMTEEELAKLSVNLLNCQSAVEGRKIFPCTEEMSLKQCTTDMDADMWNAYHLMSNRARAVCYASRSTQFRALTELTVNKLMQTAHSQIQTLGSLKEGQDRLEEKTAEALSSLSEGNKALLQQQQNLRNAQVTANQLVTTNLRELSNERALIRSGHAQLAAMAEDIRKKLEEASENLVQQAIERGENHREVLEDLMKIQEQAQHIWDKIESSTNRIFEQQEEAMEQYEQTLYKLVQINDTIHFIWNVTNTMRAEVDEKLSWITGYIGDTGEQMHRMYRTSLHVVYILGAMIVAAFLQAPFLTRVTILGIVPLNLASFLKHGAEACLDFVSLTALILLITIMHYVMIGIQYLFGPKRMQSVREPVNIVNQNGHTNGGTGYTSSSYASVSTTSLYWRLKKSLRDLYTIIRYKINEFTQKIRVVVQRAASSVTSWRRQTSVPCEELSCSYIPSKRTREDVIHDYVREFPSISDDATDFEVTHMLHQQASTDDEYDHLVDANDLRRRLNRVHRSASRATSRVSGSITPLSDMPRVLCNALTRSGRKCRLTSTQGREFCSKHLRGSSVMTSNLG